MGPAPPGILSSISTENMETTSITEDPFGGIDTSQPFNEMDFMKSWEGLDEDEPKLDDVEWTPPTPFEETTLIHRQRAIDSGVIISVE